MLSAILLLSFSVAFASDPCRFEHPDLGVIDITTLGRTDGTAAYADRGGNGANDFVYSYNPCKPFTEGPVCQNVAVCQIDQDERHSFILGTQESTTWDRGPIGGMPQVRYQYGEKTVIVSLQCTTSSVGDFRVRGEGPMNTYFFELTHQCACWNGCSSTTSTITSMAPTTSPTTSDACRFVHPEKGVINLSFIGRTDDKAAYSDEVTRAISNYKYSFNPCRSFSQGNGCIGVSACQVSYDGRETFTLGTQESAWWDAGSDDNAMASLNYAYGSKKVTIFLQ